MFEVKKNIINRSVEIRGIYPNSEVYVQKWVTINGKRYLVDGVGKTKCTKENKFDKEFGIELAQVRAEINMAKDYEKILISLTKQPEWRKEKPKEEFIVEPQDHYHIDGHVHIFNNHNDNKKIKVTVEVL